jgi:hypothetical protein
VTSEIPTAWERIGTLTFSGPRITPADKTVTFFATRKQAGPSIRIALQAFASTLPTGVSLSFESGRP